MTFEFEFFDKLKRKSLFRNRDNASINKIEIPDYKNIYSHGSFMVWEEHCVECSPPDCYRSCLLYEQGVTVDCRRFFYGIFRDNNYQGLMGYGAEIFFKRWAKLEAVYNTALLPIFYLKVLECFYHILVRFVKICSYVRLFFFKKHIYPRFKMFQSDVSLWLNKKNKENIKRRHPDVFIVGVINMESFSLDMHISFTQINKDEVPVKYDETIRLEPGFNEHHIDYKKIVLALGDADECLVAVTLVNDIEALLKFTALDFVVFNKKVSEKVYNPDKKNKGKKLPKIKCLVFDLDNTLWNGTLINDGHIGIKIKKDSLDVIRELDKRGVLLSIASKNDFNSAWESVCAFKIQDYFLYPQIHWGLKSESIKRIAKNFNIGIDTIAFIDDSLFELEEVRSTLPDVRCYNANEMTQLLNYDEFIVPVTPEAVNRRNYYKTQQNFQKNEKEWKEERLDFLKSCNMVMVINKPQKTQVDRCYELIQRTNQLNLSGRRYEKEEFIRLLSENSLDCFVLDFKDKFGSYGIIGIAIVRIRNTHPELIELAISCRVARRKVEQSFICWLANRYYKMGFLNFSINMRATERNGLLMRAFEELNTVRNDVSKDIIQWTLPLKEPLPQQHIISIIEK